MVNKKGFTLVELLISIAVIGVLAAVTLSAVQNAQARARDTKRRSDIRTIMTSLEARRIDIGAYYKLGTGSGGFGNGWVNIDNPSLSYPVGIVRSLIDDGYLSEAAIDPQIATGDAVLQDGYMLYNCSYPNKTNAAVFAKLEQPTPEDAQRISDWLGNGCTATPIDSWGMNTLINSAGQAEMFWDSP